MKTTIPQIFEELEKAGSKETRIGVLRAYDHPILRGILQINFDPNVTVQLPEGEPPFKKDTSIPVGYSESNLYAEFRRFYIWLDPNVNVTKIRKEQLFIQFLEGIHWSEAEVIILAKDRKLQTKFKQLKEELVRDAFPGLLPAPIPKELAKLVKPKGTPKVKKSDSLNVS
jgi:Family of unknown function (DUF6433)